MASNPVTCLTFVGVSSTVVAINPSNSVNGAIVWTWEAPKGTGEPTLLYDPASNQLFVSVVGFCYSLNPTDGTVNWENDTPGYGTGIANLVLGPPATDTQAQYLYVGFNSYVLALNPSTGETIQNPAQPWESPDGSGEVVLLLLPTSFENGMLIASVEGYTYGLSLVLDQLWKQPLHGIANGTPSLASIC